jgi:hypothetical protein
MTILYFFLFLWGILAFLDPDSDPATQINAELDTDPDPKPCPCVEPIIYRYTVEEIYCEDQSCGFNGLHLFVKKMLI